MKKKFVVVCGLPRSGTRQFTDYLNHFDDFSIQGEISEKLIEDFCSLMRKADECYLDSKYKEMWLNKRADFVCSNFMLLQKGRVEQSKEGRFVGFKTPYIESYYKDIRSMVYPSFESVDWMFCVRDFMGCYRSLSSMPWFNRTASSFSYKFVKSLSSIIQIEKTKKKGAESSCVINLSDYIASSDKKKWLESVVFSRFYDDVSGLGAVVDFVGNRNSGENRFGVKKPVAIPQEDMEVFYDKKEVINSSIERFNDIFDESLPLIEI